MEALENPNSIPSRFEKKIRITSFINPVTIKQLDSLKIIYGTTSGQLLDAFVHSVITARATKCQWCITGKKCQFNQPFPEEELIR